jgi:hypothetical protein
MAQQTIQEAPAGASAAEGGITIPRSELAEIYAILWEAEQALAIRASLRDGEQARNQRAQDSTRRAIQMLRGRL